jgi:Kdo2-lipid IVA lauroyltransferase/acyltransferase
MSGLFVKRVKRKLVYWFVRVCIFWFNLLPRRVALWKGASIGWLAWWLLQGDRRKIDSNLRRVYGDRLTLSERKEIGRRFFINSGKNLVDVLRFRRHFSQIRPLVEVEGLEHFDRAYKAGKGLIGITGHIGNFELLAAYMASLGYEIAVIGREMYDPRLNQLLVDNRTAVGLTNIATTDSPKRIFRWLHEGKALGVLIDTDSMRVRGMFVPFFGIPANTPIGHALIGLKVGAAFVPGACVRIQNNRYRLIFRPAIEIPPSDSPEAATEKVTLLSSKALEGLIDEYRDQWIWLHNRWNSQPPNRP